MTQIHDEHHHHHQTKRERDLQHLHAPRPSPLRVNKHFPLKRHPVIIYTHSPKIIHTQPQYFMSLVQQLTGLGNADDRPSSGSQQSVDRGNSEKGFSSTDESSDGFHQVSSSSSSLMAASDVPPNPFLADIPLFTPNSLEFFCSPLRFYRFPDSVFTPAGAENPVSPSVLEVMKGFPQY